MKKEEKTRRTYERIMTAAMEEFGTKSYDAASLTTLCSENQISKGLIYHNFKNKDELYLKCVEECFEKMTLCFKNSDCQGKSVQERIHDLLSARQYFFEENPYYANLFFQTVLQPPRHLEEEIRTLRREYDEFYEECFRSLLQQMELRDGINTDTAVEYIRVFLEMFNGYFQRRSCKDEDIHTLIQNHEVNLSKILDIMLYGIAKEDL